jgi:putative ABC transport system permease protein
MNFVPRILVSECGSRFDPLGPICRRNHERISAGHPLRASHASAVPRIHGHCDLDIGAGHRRKHRALLGREWRPAQSLALPATGPPGCALLPHVDLCAIVHQLPEFSGLARNNRSLSAVAAYRSDLLGVFAALALVLACVGIYGVISYLASQRTHEIGIRIALGAQRASVLRLVVGEGARMALIGVALGTVAALGLTRLMANQLYGISAHDPLTFGGVALLLAIVAVAACYLPAHRAMSIDPVVALRNE